VDINQNIVDMYDLILLIFFLTALFLTWFFTHKARVKERLLLIEKGIDPTSLPKSGSFKFIFPWLKIGIVITSISVGLLLAAILMEMPFFSKIADGLLPLLLIFLFGGIGMILAYLIDKPQEQN
jgi:hypothetical protein